MSDEPKASAKSELERSSADASAESDLERSSADASADASAESSDAAREQEAKETIARLPRAPLFRKLSMPALVRIGMFATLLYAVVVMRRPCAEGVGRFVTGFDDSPDAAPASVLDRYPGYELLTAEEALKRWPDAPRDGGLLDAGPSGDATGDPTGNATGNAAGDPTGNAAIDAAPLAASPGTP